MKTTFLEVANVRDVINYIETDLPVPTEAVGADKPIHDNLLSFPCVFTGESKSICIPLGFLLKEYNEAEVLKQNVFNIEFFLDDGANVIKNQGVRVYDFKYITNVKFVMTTNYDVYKNTENKTVFAVSYKILETEKYRICKLNSTSLYFAIFATTGFDPYPTTTKLKFGMFYKLV